MGDTILSSTQRSAPAGTKIKHAIWPALAIALGLHLILLMLPVSRQAREADPVYAKIDLQLTTYTPRQSQKKIYIPDDPATPDPTTQVDPELTAPKPESQPMVKVPSETPLPIAPTPIERNLENMSPTEKARLTSSILSSQFISEDSAADQLFGKRLDPYVANTQKDFYFPARPDLVSMLDQPLQKLPFEYTPGLVNFAYAAGIKGDLQRFGDRITPEFSWITQYGTEVKCIWVLVIVACGWGRP